MSKSTERAAKPEKAHVTIDPGMGSFYEWFMTCDRRYRARELVHLARWAHEERSRRAAEPSEARPSNPPAPSATATLGSLAPIAQREEPEGFDHLIDPAMH
ncbi:MULTISPECIES: hypothetical protein [Ramlibacter]|uniref:Uncharacterized protein n=1 Tax=Ramlibacter aquaticus TaxID=2780094 RepID=A0ABR9SCQ2_9BURK|nr:MULTISPECIES: hypothetical protein [Ramlibacter]MBE7940131.1 hypothetical protein [Ramlibacter aquaticus]